MKILTLTLVLSFLAATMALFKEDDPRLLSPSFWEERRRDNEVENLVSYPVDVDGWNEETQKDFINFIENEFNEDTSQSHRPGSGGKPLTGASGVVSLLDQIHASFPTSNCQFLGEIQHYLI